MRRWQIRRVPRKVVVCQREWQLGGDRRKKKQKTKNKKMEEAESEQPGSPKEAFIER